MNGEYKEQLPIGFGNLIVTKSDYYIQIELPGPDKRYAKEILTIYKHNMDNYIEAYKLNWKKYLELKEMKSILGEEFSTKGELDMTINVGDCFEGVCIYAYHKSLNSETEINNMIGSIQWAKEKGPKIMGILNNH
jgi:hypothetical protein